MQINYKMKKKIILKGRYKKVLALLLHILRESMIVLVYQAELCLFRYKDTIITVFIAANVSIS